MTTDELKNQIHAQLGTLQGLLEYLEDQAALSAREYRYCQIKLHEVLGGLRQLERGAKQHRPQA